MRGALLALSLLVSACAAAPPAPQIYPEAEAAPPHIMAAVRAVAPRIALSNVSVDGEDFLIEGVMPNQEVIHLRVVREGERWVAHKLEH